jgi:hypothetical protein
MGKVGQVAGGILAANFAMAVGRKVGQFFSSMISEAREAEKVTKSTAQGIKTMGAETWTSTKAIEALSKKLSEQIGVDDELIQQTANLLLTFGNVKNAGKGLNAIFDRAVVASQDLAAKGFGSADAAAKMLGKALNDPIKGITALQRAGVQFTEAQKAQIKTMVEAGDILGAQKIIMKEVEKQVGGTAAAVATSADKMSVKWNNVKEALGKKLLPVLDKAADAGMKMLDVFGKLPGPLQEGAVAIGLVSVAALVAAPRIVALSAAMKAAGINAGGMAAGLGKAIPIIGAMVVAAELLDAKFGHTKGSLDEFLKSGKKLSGGGATDLISALQMTGLTVDDLASSTDVVTKRVDELKAAYAETGSVEAAIEKVRVMHGGQTDLQKATQETTDEIKDQITEVKDLSEVLDTLFTDLFDVEEAQDGLSGSIADYIKQAKDGKISTRDLRTAGRDLTKQSYDLIDALVESGASTGEVTAKQKSLKTQLYNTLVQMGMSKTEAKRYADSLDLIPTSVATSAVFASMTARERIAAYKTLLASIPAIKETTVYVNKVISTSLKNLFEHGGITGAAGGGPRGRTTLVGEHGPELVDLAPGSQVHSNPDTERMIKSNGHGGPVVLELRSSGSRLDDLLLEVLRNSIRVKGGNVQLVLGS